MEDELYNLYLMKFQYGPTTLRSEVLIGAKPKSRGRTLREFIQRNSLEGISNPDFKLIITEEKDTGVKINMEGVVYMKYGKNIKYFEVNKNHQLQDYKGFTSQSSNVPVVLRKKNYNKF